MNKSDAARRGPLLFEASVNACLCPGSTGPLPIGRFSYGELRGFVSYRTVETPFPEPNRSFRVVDA